MAEGIASVKEAIAAANSQSSAAPNEKQGRGRPKKDKGKEPENQSVFEKLGSSLPQFLKPTASDPNFRPEAKNNAPKVKETSPNADAAQTEQRRRAAVGRLNSVLGNPTFQELLFRESGQRWSPAPPNCDLASAQQMQEQVDAILSMRYWRSGIDRFTVLALQGLEKVSGPRIPLYGYADFYQEAKSDVYLEQVELAALLAHQVGSAGPIQRYIMKLVMMGATVYQVNTDPKLREQFIQQAMNMKMAEKGEMPLPQEMRQQFQGL